MGFRFQKRFGFIGNLIRFNVSKSGVSVSVGPPGLSVTFGRKGRSTINTGIPGSGLSYRKRIGRKRK